MTKKRISSRNKDRGSALLVSLMVMVGLSLLGLAFVAVSETESAIAVNEQNSTQTLDLAEAAAKAVVEWYQAPEWATNRGLMPAVGLASTFKRERRIDLTNASALTNIGRYKPSGTYFCCETPFKPNYEDRLWGTEASPDILIDMSTSEGRTFLSAFTDKLFTDRTTGQITEIRIYAPPMLNANENSEGFFDQESDSGKPQRYGVATIAVTATKYVPALSGAAAPASSNRIAARHTVKIVVSEYPFPGPQGPVQSNASISTGGDMVVHWGKMTSQRSMFIKRPLKGLPWLDAYTRLPFERGYDSCIVWKSGLTFYDGQVVCPTQAKITANTGPAPTLGRLGFKVEGAPAAGWASGATEPAFEAHTTINTVFTEGAVTYRVRERPIATVDPASGLFRNQEEFLFSVVGETIEDPWIEARTRDVITNGVITSATNAPTDRSGYPHPFKYATKMDNVTSTEDVGWSNWFQDQDVDDGMDRQRVTFPRIDYDFWKQTALTGRGTEGVYYLEWVADDRFTDGRTTKDFAHWVNIDTGAQPGFYFFETKNKQNPQNIANPTNLTPEISLNSGGLGGADFQMAGFIYLNSVSFGSQGIGGVDGYYNAPGEPFQDIGFYTVDPSTGNWTVNATTGQYVVQDNGNGKWDFQDLDGDGFDLFLALQRRKQPDGTVIDVWLPVPYTPRCTPGNNGDVGANCSEPHEPYLNLVYPEDACCAGAGAPNPLVVGWENPSGTITRRRKEAIDDTGTMPTVDSSEICTDTAQFDHCTSNKHDRDGAADDWTGNDAPILNGVLYNQGTFESTGNARLYGSVLINGDVDPNGTNEVWFDERLIKNDWPPEEWPFPRVIITAIETDQ